MDATPLEDFEEHLPFESEDHDGAFAFFVPHPPRIHQHVASPCLRMDKKDQDQAGYNWEEKDVLVVIKSGDSGYIPGDSGP
jgi:hypothetical protein